MLLPVADEGDALAEAEAALREHEPLDEVRAETVPFLRDVVVGALGDALAVADAGDQALAAAYDRAARTRRLEGVLPDGLFGRAMRERHLVLLGCWRDGILRATGGLLSPPAPVWLGAAPEHRRDVVLRPPLAVPLSDGSSGDAQRDAPRSAARAADESRVVLSLHASSEPGQAGAGSPAARSSPTWRWRRSAMASARRARSSSGPRRMARSSVEERLFTADAGRRCA